MLTKVEYRVGGRELQNKEATITYAGSWRVPYTSLYHSWDVPEAKVSLATTVEFDIFIPQAHTYVLTIE